MQYGATVNLRDGITVLHALASQDNDRSDVMMVLLEHGANPKHRDKNGMLPLEVVCKQGGNNLGCIYALVQAMPGDISLKYKN